MEYEVYEYEERNTSTKEFAGAGFVTSILLDQSLHNLFV